MKALLCRAFGDPPDLAVAEVPDPAPGPGEVLIRVEAVGLGFFDALLLAGRYQEKPPLPFIPGREHEGRVLAVGQGVDPALQGARVAALAFGGALAERAVAKADHCLVVPPGMDAATAGGLLSAYATSLYALEVQGRLQAGETVLVLGGAGAVGSAAIDVAKALGARVAAAASTPEKRERCRRRGADVVVDYTAPDWRAALRGALGGGIDVVMDMVGGAVSEPAFRSLKPGGRHLVVGFASGAIPRLPLNLPLLKRASVVGVDWGGFLLNDPAGNRALLDRLGAMLADGRLSPAAPSVHGLAEVAPLLRRFLDRGGVGKPVVLPVWR